ncbi:MAG: hypothetical protein GQ544_06210 [Candidatus Aminicenantes bacterium]|nr:hypothetical protein [Candidatus Aminicenantes bacterium]
MWRCKMVDTFFTILPLKKWQDFLIRRHISNCPACMGKLADKYEVRTILIAGSEIPTAKDFWPGFISRLNQGLKQNELPTQRVWNWGYVAVGVFVTVAAIFWNLRTTPPVSPELSENFQIKSIEIDGRPAQAFLFKTEDPNMYFVWAEKNNEGE